MGSNQFDLRPEFVGMLEKGKAFAKSFFSGVVIQKMEEITKREISQPDKKAIRRAVVNGNNRKLVHVIKKVVPENEISRLVFLVDIEMESNYITVGDCIEVLLWIGGGITFTLLGADYGSILGSCGKYVGGIIGGLLGILMAVFACRCTRIISWWLQDWIIVLNN